MTLGKKDGGRLPFGFHWVDGAITEVEVELAVARRVISMRDAGVKWREIAESDGICRSDGSKMSISTLQVIVANRSKYES